MICVRAIYSEIIDMIAWFFLVTYLMQNFIVNIIDYFLFHKALGYYNDIQFQQMFSYKLFQTILCLLIATIYSQSLKPTLDIFKSNPWLLNTAFRLTIPLNICMLITFMFELTFYDHNKRQVIFKT